MNAMVPMSRLLAINNYFYRRGGAEAVFLDHIEMFEQAGWQVAPFAMQAAQNLPSKWSEYFVSEIEFGHQPGLVTKLNDARKIIYSHEAQRNIAALVERFRPQLAHAHNVYHHLSPAIFQTLKAHGVRPGDRVMLVSENRPEFCIADLAIMAAGGVTVPTYTTNTTRDPQPFARIDLHAERRRAGPLGKHLALAGAQVRRVDRPVGPRPEVGRGAADRDAFRLPPVRQGELRRELPCWIMLGRVCGGRRRGGERDAQNRRQQDTESAIHAVSFWFGVRLRSLSPDPVEPEFSQEADMSTAQRWLG